LPYVEGEEGKKMPLPGVETLFLTGTTVEILGLTHLGAQKEGGRVMDLIPKEKVLGDVQFRGAISDFHQYKAKILEADYDPLLIRVNEDDLYGDGNNFEVALRKAAADVWEGIDAEVARRKQLQRDEEIRAAIEKAKPKSKKKRVVKPWISLGSEVEIEEASVRPRREAVRMVVQRKRREFNLAFRLSDKDAHELWNSSQMECRPFKDPNFDLRKMEQDVAVQAVAATASVWVQASGNHPRPNSTQYSARNLEDEARQALLAAPDMMTFLEKMSHACEEALIQNEITNIFEDDFSALAEEDGMSGNRKESIVTEYQSFTHLTYSKNKVVSAIQWLPHRKGVVAVACTEALSHAERVVRAGRPAAAYILIWNFKDPIHPEYVLQAPFEVFSFHFNPMNPEIIAAGCYNGQVVVWDMHGEHERIASMKQLSNREGDANDEATIPIIKCRYFSAIEFSHHSVVTDLRWLPGVEISNRGKVSKAAEGSRDCSFFSTTAGDGKVNFWDIRVERLMKKGRKADADALDLVWKPIHSVHLISLLGMDLGGTRFCFNFRDLDKGLFFVGSFDGELVYADFIKPEGEDNPDYTKSCIQAHVGPVVALERSPFFDDIILSVGDWSFQIWKEGQQTPLFQSGYAADYYTAGCWSPTRPAVIYLADGSGNLEIWDMLDRSHEPSIRVTLASTPIMSMAFMGGAAGSHGAANAAAAGGGGGGGGGGAAAAAAAAGTQFLALGDSAGVLRIVELPRNLRRPVPNERKLMSVFLEREEHRVADSASRAPLRAAALKAAEERKKAAEEAEAAAREREAAAKDQQGSSGHAVPAKNAPKPPEFDERAEAEYFKLEHAFKVQLGLLEDEAAAKKQGLD